MASNTAEVYDLLILVDATYSMSSYLKSLQISLPQIIQISTLTDCFSRIGLLAYRDYCDRALLEWSGWMSPSEAENGSVDLVAAAKKLTPIGGGDGPEATKTGLARAYELMRKDATTIVLLYTDAPPHTSMNGEIGDRSSNLGPERMALREKTSYGGFGQHFVDLVSATKWLSGREGEKKAQIFCVLEPQMIASQANYYIYLATMTDGACFFLSDSRPATISRTTVEVLLSWMGAEKAGVSANTDVPALMGRYNSMKEIDSLANENDPAADKFFYATAAGRVTYYDYKEGHNAIKIQASSDVLKKYLPKKATPVHDFAKRYTMDPRYQKLAISQVKKIIEDDVIAMSINPVFGSLWRAVCNDRDNEERDGILITFGKKIDGIIDATEKARMKSWLEASYDFSADVKDAIESVPEAERFPCVFLDPTLLFTRSKNVDEDTEGDANMPITSFTRDELLEIGRSCDYKILRRLGRVLTQLTYVKSASDLPAHIAAVPEITRVPMALAKSKYKRKFWRILLHIVVPGTMLSSRPAALLAALSIRLGVEPLLNAADEEMLLWRDRWNTLDIPETWNMSCLGLLMDADKTYQERMEKASQVSNTTYMIESLERSSSGAYPDSDERPSKKARLGPWLTLSKNNTLLKPEDHELFQRLVSYRMLELNLDTLVTAQIGWTPEKTKVAMGPTVICVACEFPRSITVMGPGGKCGPCLWDEQHPPTKGREQADIPTHVSKEDNEHTLAAWVQCNLIACRVQYVVYQIEALNVKPKCHYCRASEKAPFVECSGCLNRIIYPEEYRKGDMKDFKCYACMTGRKTTVDCETTAKSLCIENSESWLLRNDDNKIAEPLNGRSVFYTISKAGTANFCKKVDIFPDSASVKLVLRGKPIRNSPALIKGLESWVLRRRVEQGTCSLCFSDFRKDALHPVCGRSACSQRVCAGCLGSWYGLNAAGRIINTGALSCPFCCRNPTSKTLARYGSGIHAVVNLKSAVDEYGEWIYAWCIGCGHAKRHMERVCAAGAPVEVLDWKCEPCEEGNGVKKQSKECPGCGVMTQKSGGCDHLTCRCGVHWCWFCGEECDANDIYNHMQNAHGGYYGDPEEEEDDGYDTDDDNW